MIGFQSDLHKNRIWADSLNEAIEMHLQPPKHISNTLATTQNLSNDLVIPYQLSGNRKIL